MAENTQSANGNAIARQDLPGKPANAETGLVLDDELSSAATPFLYLLASILIVVAAYFLYSYLRG